MSETFVANRSSDMHKSVGYRAQWKQLMNRVLFEKQCDRYFKSIASEHKKEDKNYVLTKTRC